MLRHKLLFGSDFSEAKSKFAIGKTHLQLNGRRYLGERDYRLTGEPIEEATNAAFKLIP